MSATFSQGPVMPSVATLPSASANTNRILVQGGKLWFSDGTAWIDATNTGGGGGVPWSTVTTHTAMAANNAYNVDGGWVMVLPASVPANAVFIVYAMNATVVVVANGNTITGTSAPGNDVGLAAGEMIYLVATSTGILGIR